MQTSDECTPPPSDDEYIMPEPAHIVKTKISTKPRTRREFNQREKARRESIMVGSGPSDPLQADTALVSYEEVGEAIDKILAEYDLKARKEAKRLIWTLANTKAKQEDTPATENVRENQ